MSKATVILTCYNGARWINQAISSVLSQTYKDFELIIVDDGSTDNSRELISSYYDKRIRSFFQRNKGFSAAVNRGIKESKSNLVGFIGQDDLWTPNKLELQVKFLNEHNDVDLVHSNYCSIDLEGRIVGVREIKIPKFLTRKAVVEKIFLKNFIGFETVLVKKKCFDAVGLLDERMTGYSDHDIWLRIAGFFNVEGYIDAILVKKRIHKSQLSNSRLEEVLKDEFLMVTKAIDQYPFLKSVQPRKLASLYYVWGVYLLQIGRHKEAKQKLVKAIKCQPWKLKASGACLLPDLYAFILHRYIKSEPGIHSGLKWIEG